MLQEIIAKGELSKFVESFWEATGQESVLLPPDGTFNILFSGSPFVIGAATMVALPAGAYILPLHTNMLQIKGASPLLGIRLKAFSKNNILSNKNTLLLNINEGLQQINPHSSLIQATFLRWDTEMRLADYMPALEQVMFELLTKGFVLNEQLRDKVNYILDRKGCVNIEEMAKEFAISRQRLHKIFVDSIHVSPKELAGIWQFNHYLSLINSENSLTVSALDSGYYDQAHGINDFKKRFGCAPSALLKNEIPSLDFIKKCIANRFNNGYDPS